MRKACIFIATLIAAVGIANGAVRDEKNISRTTQKSIISRQSVQPTSVRATPKKTVTRTASQKHTANTRVQSRATVPGRVVRTDMTSRTTTAPQRQTKTNNTTYNTMPLARATIAPQTVQSNLFTPDYNTCRDAYFTCMDQFCATANDTYRRCICSSKLSEIQARERALGQTAEQLNDFINLNLDVIDKNSDEVTAMLSATHGESAQENAHDKSNSAKQLAGISEVLNKTKKQSLSTQGTVDIAGNIDAIWSTSNLAGGANIANLTGEALYNAVHAQCSEMVINSCNSAALQNMVTTAYGMYIENDCSALISTLDSKKKGADTSIRQTEREMQLARLENYKAHNSTAINECIAQIRTDITADTACGPDYVHCLDVTGLYLNRETGEPIYSPSFYQLETITSMSGDTLTNQSNRLLVAELNRKRAYAERGLDTCRDIADSVWDEFMRQAISEIYQGQQERVRQVKNECLEVVNKCYDEKNQSLKDFSNVKEQLLLGQRIELSEKMCQEKLDACSNLYGGGPNGMAELLIAMRDIMNQTISNQCLATLREYTHEFCAVPGNDTLHTYPFACRVYKPGDAKYIYDDTDETNKDNYIGSLYDKIASYASQACIRPSQANNPLPATVLQDINTVMDEIRHEMAKSLANECQRLGGTWYDTIWQDSTTIDEKHDTQGHWLHKKFYADTAANTDWGYCGTDDVEQAQTITTNTGDNSTGTNTDNDTPTTYTLTFINTNSTSCTAATPATNTQTITIDSSPEKATIPTCVTPANCTFKGYLVQGETRQCFTDNGTFIINVNQCFNIINNNTTHVAIWNCE